MLICWLVTDWVLGGVSFRKAERRGRFCLEAMTDLRVFSPQANEVDPGVLVPKVLWDVDREVLNIGKTRNPGGKKDMTEQGTIQFETTASKQHSDSTGSKTACQHSRKKKRNLVPLVIQLYASLTRAQRSNFTASYYRV